MTQSIELTIGCAPGETRPDFHYKNLIDKLIKNDIFNNEIKEFLKSNKLLEPNTKSFGDWIWIIQIPNYINSEQLKNKNGFR